MTSSSRLRGAPALAALAAALVLAVAPAAESHAVLVRSLPASRATLRQSPSTAELWFSERLEPAFSTLSVWSASGTQVDRGDTTLSRDDQKRLSATLLALAPGRYTVRYRVLSVDGHVAEGSFAFSVAAAH